MSQDAMQAARDLAAVHRFYAGLLERRLQHEIPAPEVVQDILQAGEPPVEQELSLLRRWLNLLDLATAPALVRDALKETATYEIAESLLRYYAERAWDSDESRDKTDFVATYLFRSRLPQGTRAPEGPEGVAFQAAQETSAFEQEVERILADHPAPALLPEHRQLVSEFTFIRQEVEEFRDFDRMMEAGVVQRVREIKQSFGRHFYHPTVLATVASYNSYFGRRFDELFRQAAEQIKSYAARVQEEGGSILSRVDGDVLLKDLTELEESRIMSQEYSRAQEQFRRVSRFKQAVERRRGRSPAEAAAAAAAGGAAAGQTANVRSSWRQGPSRLARAASDEEAHTRAMQDSIRSFVRGAKPGALAMPLRSGTLALSAAEADAFRSDYAEEKSFRGQYVTLIMRSLAIQARMIVETAEYHTHKDTAYLWKGPADALAALLASAETMAADGGQLAETANRRGLTDKANAIEATLEKLRQQSLAVVALLRSLPAR